MMQMMRYSVHIPIAKTWFLFLMINTSYNYWLVLFWLITLLQVIARAEESRQVKRRTSQDEDDDSEVYVQESGVCLLYSNALNVK